MSMYGSITGEKSFDGRAPLLAGAASPAAGSPASRSPAEPPPRSASAPREALLAVAQRNAKRVAQCRSVPASLAFYVLFIVAMLTHVKTGPSFDFETALSNEFTYAFNGLGAQVYDQGSFFDWLSDTFIPAAASLLDYNSLPVTTTPGRVAGGHARIVGGVRLLQRRASPAPCALPTSALNYVYNGTCYTASADPNAGPMSTGTKCNAARRNATQKWFEPSTLAGDDSGPAFQGIIYFNVTQTELQARIGCLKSNYWLDGATVEVAVQFAALNGATGQYARVELSARFTRGGRIDFNQGVYLTPLSTIVSLPVAPYAGSDRAWMFFSDIVIFLYWLYLLQGLLRRAIRASRPMLQRTCGLGCGYRATTSVEPFLAPGARWWLFLDLLTVTSLLVTIVTWLTLQTRLKAVADGIASDVDNNVDIDAQTDIQLRIFTAAGVYSSFKLAAVLTLVALTMRIFKYFAFQPRLAVLTDAIALSVSDALHFGLIFGIMLTMYGVWGHFMFGTQSFDWHNVQMSVIAIFRFTMYDYDLGAMEASSFVMADLFFVTFMLIITNMGLWMLLAVFLESYTEVRAASHRGDTMWAELAALVATFPATLSDGLRLVGLSSGRGSEATWAAVADALSTGPLKAHTAVSVAQLTAVLLISQRRAERFVADAHRELDAAVLMSASAAAGAGRGLGSRIKLGRALSRAAGLSLGGVPVSIAGDENGGWPAADPVNGAAPLPVTAAAAGPDADTIRTLQATILALSRNVVELQRTLGVQATPGSTAALVRADSAAALRR